MKVEINDLLLNIIHCSVAPKYTTTINCASCHQTGSETVPQLGDAYVSLPWQIGSWLSSQKNNFHDSSVWDVGRFMRDRNEGRVGGEDQNGPLTKTQAAFTGWLPWVRSGWLFPQRGFIALEEPYGLRGSLGPTEWLHGRGDLIVGWTGRCCFSWYLRWF